MAYLLTISGIWHEYCGRLRLSGEWRILVDAMPFV